MKKKCLAAFAAIAILACAAGGRAEEKTVVYKNKENGFAMRFPATWEIKEGVDGTAVQARGPAQGKGKDQFRPLVSVSVEAVPPQTTLSEYVSRGIDKARKSMPDFQVYHLGRQTIAHTNAKWWNISYRADRVTVKGFLTMLVKGGKAYTIVSVVPIDQYPSSRDLLGSFSESFGFL